jgi:hypothetical protein
MNKITLLTFPPAHPNQGNQGISMTWIGHYQRVVFTTPPPLDHRKVKSPQARIVEGSKDSGGPWGGSCGGLNYKNKCFHSIPTFLWIMNLLPTCSLPTSKGSKDSMLWKYNVILLMSLILYQ